MGPMDIMAMSTGDQSPDQCGLAWPGLGDDTLQFQGMLSGVLQKAEVSAVVSANQVQQFFADQVFTCAWCTAHHTSGQVRSPYRCCTVPIHVVMVHVYKLRTDSWPWWRWCARDGRRSEESDGQDACTPMKFRLELASPSKGHITAAILSHL